MKKNVRTLFPVLLIAAVFTVPGILGQPRAAAQEYVPDRTPVRESGDYSYKVYDDGAVVIVEYRGEDAHIEIPAELDGNIVTSIGGEAFAYQEMDSLTIPEGISVTGRAFEYCEILESLTLPAGVVIQSRAFEYADLPEAVILPEDALIEGDAFSYCEDLKTLFVSPGAVLKGEVFSYSEDLKTVWCASGSKIADKAFYSCRRLTDVVLCGDVELEGKPFPYSSRARFLHEEEERFDREAESALASSGKRIGRDEALRIALEDAGLKATQVRNADVELNRSGRSEYYEVEFRKGSVEYEYRIDAYTGEILSAEKDR